MLRKVIKIVLKPIEMEEKMELDEDKRSTSSVTTPVTPSKTGVVKGSGAKPASAKKKEQDTKKVREKTVKASVATGAMGESIKSAEKEGDAARRESRGFEG